MSQTQRLQKIIAQSGLTSRRQAESLIRQGRVKVNGSIAALGDKACQKDSICVDGKRISVNPAEGVEVLLLNKPEGYICSRKDPGGRRTVFELLPEITSGRWIGVGRLDINTTGLLLFSSNGELANRLMHPSANIEREYICRVYGEINKHKINRLREGIKLDSYKSLSSFHSISPVSGSGRNQWYKVVLTQGRYREVRRLWQAVGCQVNRLSRIRFGDLVLPKRLSVGKSQYLTDEQVDRLRQMVGVR